ncbi:MAG: VOC family protein [Microgenomates group bacterium]
MNFSKLHHIAIICSNYERSKKFYTEILGFRIVNETYRKERNSYKLDLAINESTQIELFSFPNPPARLTRPEAQGLRHIAFTVENIDSVVKELNDAGVITENVRVDDTTGKRFTFFSDPDDLPIEIYEV